MPNKRQISVDTHHLNCYNVSEEKEVNIRTLRDNQSQVLISKLETLLPRITEEGKHKVAESLLKRLKRLEPNQDRVWADLHLPSEEDELFDILCKLVWGGPPQRTKEALA